MIKRLNLLYHEAKREKLLIAAAVVFWLFLIMTTVSKTYFLEHMRGSVPAGVGLVLLRAFLVWGIAVLFVPLFIWLAKSRPLEGGVVYRNVVVHIILSIAFVLVYVLCYEIIMYPSYNFLSPEADKLPWTWKAFFESYLASVSWLTAIGSLLYWLVMGAYHLKKYSTQFKERQVRNMEMEARLASIRLHVLKVQLHPHFLFNTLHNVNSLIHEDTATAERMLVLLKRFLQRSINRMNEHHVSLKDEIEFTGTYLEIEKTRFGRRLAIEIDVDPNTLDAKVPNLMLQPLVENAVRHGISKKMRPGMIRITSGKRGERLSVTIEDDGPGLNGKVNSNGVGLENIRQRLSRLYSDPLFELSSSSMGGFKVQIEIPFESFKPNEVK